MRKNIQDASWTPAEGGCDCGRVRFRIDDRPLIVHCCHCRWCQRETGAAFALNAVIETDRVRVLKNDPVLVNTPSESGDGQQIARCPTCQIAVWSHYSGAGPLTRLMRVGTLDDPDLLPPDIHIFVASKQPWVVIPEGATVMQEFYDVKRHWSKASLARLATLKPMIKAYRERGAS